MADLALRQIRTKTALWAVLQASAFSIVIALLAQVKIPLWFTPIPVTLQTLGVMLAGGLLGSKKGTAAVAIYLLQIVVGLPVLAGGSINAAAMVGMTGGYLLGMLFQAYLVGWFCERWSAVSLWKTAAGIVMSSFLQLMIGAVWLSLFVGTSNAFMMGLVPFVFGEAAKAMFALPIIQAFRR